MRIVAGRFRGRPLATPAGNAIRPTSERHRGALFNILEHSFGFSFMGARVLDLFAGTGALGLEAVSRGAKFCLFVEESTQGRALIWTNIESFGLQGCTKIFRRDATRLGDAGSVEPFDLVLLDPPYGRRLGEAALAGALRGAWLAPAALIILEEALAAPFEPIEGLVVVDEREMGETRMRFLRVADVRSIAGNPALTKT